MAVRIIDIAGRIAGVLTPQQRTIAANQIRDRASGKSGGAPEGKAASALEAEGTTSEALWAGGRSFYAGGYGAATGFGFARGYGVGYGGGFLL
jgi:hypothetical protein